MINLIDAFGIKNKELIAIVGGGGKTSLLFALAEALAGRVVITTTTRIFAAQMNLATAVSIYNPDENWGEWLAELEAKLQEHGSCLVVGEVQGAKAFGVPPDLPAQLLATPFVDALVVEADGSRMLPIKAPAAHEPVIPTGTTLLVPTVGIDALDGVIADVAHRPELVRGILGAGDWGLEIGDWRLDVEDVAQLLVSEQGGMKDVPAGARVIPLINKVETDDQLNSARQIAHHAIRLSALSRVEGTNHVSQIVIAALKSKQPVREVQSRITAVILAAGQGKRMGQTKQLLPWGKTTMLGQTIRHAQQSLAHEVLVVSGHEAQKIEVLAQTEGVQTVYNPNYASGEMLSSLQTAVSHLDDSVTAVLILLADQPMVEPETMNQLLFAFWQGKGDLIAPQFAGQRGNPVLIGGHHFGQLLALPAGDAPRTLLKRHPVTLVEVVSDSVLIDLDTVGEYGRYHKRDT